MVDEYEIMDCLWEALGRQKEGKGCRMEGTCTTQKTKEKGWQPSVPMTGHINKTLKNGECHPCRDGRKLTLTDKPTEPNAEEEPTF